MDTHSDEKVVVMKHLSRIVLGSSEVLGANFSFGCSSSYHIVAVPSFLSFENAQFGLVCLIQQQMVYRIFSKLSFQNIVHV